ncbi:uncharacterized protein LOC129576165 [Sitodiplosis mosellana]|uniref:uncharacterized protein LOC129576165 n=1 Tax=Sitodiplosis mosellana TaxID=263140 RepID=UPI0024443693|nr:uncharacterized protein LOC129576165 [Sitodiplosis mosellana]
MITNRVQGDYSHNKGFGQQTTNTSNDQIEHNHSIYHNRNRNKHTILLLITILICKCCAVTADSTEPPDCSSIVCDLQCPSDSKVVRIDNYDSILLAMNATEAPPPQPLHEAITLKRKRAILTRRRESIKIVPGDYIRRRRDANNDTSLAVATAQKCCECKCDFDKCPEFKCPPNTYKMTVAQASQVPGSCCAKYRCTTEKPTCYSHNLRRHINALEQWSEDPCTHCTCTETGETSCEASICKSLNCEKRRTIEGECCQVCDISDSKFCEPEIECDRQCRNGFEHDPVRGCAICTCAKSNATTTTTISTSTTTKQTTLGLDDIANSTIAVGQITTTQSTTWDTETSTDFDLSPDIIDNMNASSTKPINNDEDWYVPLRIVLGICVTIAAFAIVVSLTCRRISHKKDKHHLNRKQNAPLL